MKLHHGIDLIECGRIADVARRHGKLFLDRVLTENEQACARRYRNPTPFLAGRWAAKEAVLKMLGTGWRGEIAWTDIEILPDELGQPHVTLHGPCARIAERVGVTRVVLSISHAEHYATASAIGVG